MNAYLIKRLLLVIPTLLILSILVFLLVRFIPGDVIDIMHSKMGPLQSHAVGANPIDREAMERLLGLDVPVYVQYGRWVGDILLSGSLGKSLFTREAVGQQILVRLPVTVELGAMAVVIGLLIALPVGVYSAIRQDTLADYAGRSVAIIGLSTPNFWLGTMVMVFPAIWWSWAPPHAADQVRRRSAGESRDVPHSQPDSGDGPVREHHADDAHHDAGGAKAGLYPHRLVQGTQREGRGDPTRPQECLHPGGDPDRSAVAYPGRGRRDHGEHLQPAGDRSSLGECTE